VIEQIIHDQALQAILVLALIASLADLAAGVIAAVVSHTFSVSKIAEFLSTHVLGRVIPIVAVAFVASALSAAVGGIGAAPAVLATAVGAAWATAWAGVIAYVLETLASLGVHVQTVTTPQGTSTP
jgi:hypothetical protein